MADYYSLLARAVANLPKSAPPSARRAIYERARKALTNQLRSLKPQLPESDIAREERALDEAVAKLETEFEAHVAEAQAFSLAITADLPVGDMASAERARTPRPPPTAAPSPLRPFEPPAFRPPPPPPRTVAPVIAPRTPAPPRSPVTPRPPTTPTAPLPPAAPPVAAPAPAAAVAGLPNATAFKAPLVAEPAPPPTPNAAEPSLGGAGRETFDDAGDAPALGAPPNRYDREPARPMLHNGQRRKAPTWLWVVGAIAVGFAGSIAVVAWLMRPALQDLSAPAPPSDPQVVEAPAAPGKSVSRVGAPVVPPPTVASTATPDSPSPTPTSVASDTPTPVTRAPTPLPEPAPTASDTPTASPSPPPSPSASASPTPTAVASPSPTAAPTPPAPASAATVPIASRAAMLLATVADAAKPAISVGTAIWTVVPAPPGQPQAVGVKAEIDVPDLKLHASMILRKNFDASLPASHTVDLRLTFDPGSPIKGVKDIALPLMRRDDPPAADALAGVRVKISDNYFLIGLNRGDSDISKNLQEIAERGWFDFPMQLDDDRIAKLTFEKGSDGERIVAQALAAWK